MRLIKWLWLFFFAATIGLVLAACSGTGRTVNANGMFKSYVVDDITIPTTANDANKYGFNIDLDEQGRTDNALGQILSALGHKGDLNLQMMVDKQISRGFLTVLLGIKTVNLSNATGVTMQGFFGDEKSIIPTPCIDAGDMECRQHLDGSGMFTIRGEPPQEAKIIGTLVGGRFIGSPGEVALEFSLVPGSSLKIKLIGARMEIEQISDEALISGKLGGAITKDELDDSVLPTLATLLKSTIEGDCTLEPVDCPGENCNRCGCSEGATGRTLLDLFDEEPEDGDCMVSLEELKENSLIALLLAPDVDLLNCPAADSKSGECSYQPRTDKIKDALSLGIGFSAVKGTFTLPAASE